VARIGEFYAADARFKDPFNEVQGVPAIQRIFTHMYEALDQPRFVVTGRVVHGAAVLPDLGFLASPSGTSTRAWNRRCAAARTWCWTPHGPDRVCTATTGTRPKSCTKSCPWWAR
jgi:hypothetical protein